MIATFGRSTRAALDKLEPRSFLQGDIHNGDVRLGGLDHLQGLRGAFCLAADFKIGLPVDQGREPVAHQRMIVNEEDLSFHRHSVCFVSGVPAILHETTVPCESLWMSNAAPIIAAR